MVKKFLLGIILLWTTVISVAQLNVVDYSVYAAIVKTEIIDSTKSIAILKNSIDSAEKNENTFLIADQLSSNNLSDRYEVYQWTQNSKKERPSIIDSSSALLIIDYCKSNIDKFTLTNNFNQVYKTILIKKFPIKRKSIQQNWKTFYEKYPGSGGIFSFSKIKYYVGDTTSIVYYWIRSNGLNGHGALAVLKKNNGEWEMEYKIYLWHN